MEKVNSYILAALKRLGGEQRLVPGARVGALAIHLANEDGFDLRAALKSLGLKFGAAARALVATESLEFESRVGTDFLLGFKGATIEDRVDRPRLRKDFYLAFARVRNSKAYYVPDDDTIVTEPTEDRSVEIASPQAADLWAMRRKFADEVTDEARPLLIAAAEATDRRFSDFAAIVKTAALSPGWNHFQNKYLRECIEEWARSNNLAVQTSWFTDKQKLPIRKTSADAFQAILGSLTDDELSRIMIPADIVRSIIGRQNRA